MFPAKFPKNFRLGILSYNAVTSTVNATYFINRISFSGYIYMIKNFKVKIGVGGSYFTTQICKSNAIILWERRTNFYSKQ